MTFGLVAIVLAGAPTGCHRAGDDDGAASLAGPLFAWTGGRVAFADPVRAKVVSDVDRDGDDDVVVGGDGFVQVLENRRTGTLVPGPRTVLAGTTAAPLPALDVVVFDLPGDALPDLMVLAYPPEMPLVLENAGGLRFNARPDLAAGLPPILPLRAFSADLDGDGLREVIGGTDATLAIRPSAGGGLAVTTVFPEPLPYGIQRTGDVDGDGRIDVLFRGLGGAWRVTLNDGQGALTAAGTLLPAVDGSLADRDGDGDLDVLGLSFGPGSGVAWHQNLGGGSFAPLQLLAPGIFPAAWGWLIEARDVDADGRTEVVSPSHGGIAFAEPGGAFSTVVLEDVTSPEMLLLDLDGDARLDALTPDEGGFHVILQGEGRRFGDPPALVLPFEPLYPARIADLAGDSRPEALVHRVLPFPPYLDVLVVIGFGSGTPAVVASTNLGGRGTVLAIGNVDGDACADVLVQNWAGSPAGVVAWLGNGDGTFAAAPILSVPPWFVTAFAADVDSDGDLDLLGLYEPTVVRNDGAGVFTPEPGSGPSLVASPQPLFGFFPIFNQALRAGDRNGDGFPDLSITSSFGASPGVVAYGLPGGGYGPFFAIGDPHVPLPSVSGWLAFDVNGDGAPDWIDVSLRLWLADRGDGLSDRVLRPFPLPLAGRGAVAGDLDGDGQDDDLFVDGPAGSYGVVLGDGGAFAVETAPSFFGSRRRILIPDVDGDGLDDLLVQGRDDLFVLANSGSLRPGAPPRGR